MTVSGSLSCHKISKCRLDCREQLGQAVLGQLLRDGYVGQSERVHREALHGYLNSVPVQVHNRVGKAFRVVGPLARGADHELGGAVVVPNEPKSLVALEPGQRRHQISA